MSLFQSMLLPTLLAMWSSAGGEPLISRSSSLHDEADPTHLVRPYHPTCRMIRALDGRAICAATLARLDTRPARSELRLPASEPALSRKIASNRSAQASGRYLVIGSFENQRNAEEWASYNDEFGTQVLAAAAAPTTIYRVLVGPLDATSGPQMLEILRAVGLMNIWPVTVCNGRPGVAQTCQDLAEATASTGASGLG